jgi:hypothetical protein
MSTITKPPVRQQQSQPQLKPPTPERRTESGSASEDEIRPLAYRKWQEAGCPISDGVEFWLIAETEILRRRKPR